MGKIRAAHHLSQIEARYGVLHAGPVELVDAVAVEDGAYLADVGKAVVHALQRDDLGVSAKENEGLVLHGAAQGLHLAALLEHAGEAVGLAGGEILAFGGRDAQLAVEGAVEALHEFAEAVEHTEHHHHGRHGHGDARHGHAADDVHRVVRLLSQQVAPGYGKVKQAHGLQCWRSWSMRSR